MKLIFYIFFTLVFLSCNQNTEKLPILGNKEMVNGEMIYHKVGDFEFVNQDNKIVSPSTFEGKYYIVDYFFTSCPTICPKVKKQELRVYEKFKNNENLMYLSVSVDTKYDTVPRLKWYADKLNIHDEKWHFVTGNKDHIYSVAESFFHIAQVDKTAPGGYNHDGRLILVDKERHIRSFCDGTIADDVDRFMKDVEQLLTEDLHE